MAKNILDFFHPGSPDNRLQDGDLIHIGRDANTTPSEKDIVLSSTELYNSMNLLTGLFGVPSEPSPIPVGTGGTVRGYSGEFDLGNLADTTAGTITIGNTGIFEVIASVIYDPDGNTQGNTVTMVLHNSVSGDVLLDTKSPGNGDDAVHLQGSTLISLTAGDVMTLELTSSDGRTPTYSDASFVIKPTFF